MEKKSTFRVWPFDRMLVAVVAVLWWLGNSVNAHKPEPGEVRTEIEHVL